MACAQFFAHSSKVIEQIPMKLWLQLPIAKHSLHTESQTNKTNLKEIRTISARLSSLREIFTINLTIFFQFIYVPGYGIGSTELLCSFWTDQYFHNFMTPIRLKYETCKDPCGPMRVEYEVFVSSVIIIFKYLHKCIIVYNKTSVTKKL